MKRIILVMSILAGTLMVGCADTSDIAEGENFESLSGEEVRKLITGNTLRGNFRANPLIIVFHKEGRTTGRVGFRGAGRGQWSIEKDIYCHRWSTYFGGTRRCYQWYRRPDNVYYLDNVDTFRFRGPLLGSIEPGVAPGF